MALECSGSLWIVLERSGLSSSWKVLDRSGRLWKALEPSKALLETSWNPLGAMLKRLGALLSAAQWEVVARFEDLAAAWDKLRPLEVRRLAAVTK